MNHTPRREGDELYCNRCKKRWGFREEAPPCAETYQDYLRGRRLLPGPVVERAALCAKEGTFI